MIINVKSGGNEYYEKSESQMGFEPTTLRDLVGCSNHWATGLSMESKGQIVGSDLNRIARLHSNVLTGRYELTSNINTDTSRTFEAY